MKAILLTDTHLSENTIDINKSIFEQVIKIALENNLKSVYHLGDLFNSRKHQTQELLICFFEILNQFQRNELKLIAIPGNHDKTDYKAKESILTPFQHHPAFKLVSNYEFIELSSTHEFLMIPFFDESDTWMHYFNQADKNIINDKKCILLTHIAVNGAKNNDGTKVENSLNDSIFGNFEKVLIGHYHDRNFLSEKITYIGSAYQANFGENDKKGFAILNDDYKLEFIQSEFKKYNKYKISLENKTQSELENFVNRIDKSQFNQIILEGTESQLKSVDITIFQNNGIKVKNKNIETLIGENYTSEQFVSFDKEAIILEFFDFCANQNISKDLGEKYLKKFLKCGN